MEMEFICPSLNFLGLSRSNWNIGTHIFTCEKGQQGWAGNALFFELDPYSNYLVEAESFIDILDNDLAKTISRTAELFVIYQTSWTLWLHQNSCIYQDKPLRFAPQINADLAIAHLDATCKYSSSHKKKRWMSQAITLIIPCSRHQNVKWIEVDRPTSPNLTSPPAID